MTIGIVAHTYYPEAKRSMDKLSENSGQPLEWGKKTGIKEVHVAKAGEITTNLAIKSAKKALKSSSVDPMDLDQLIYISEGINDYLYMDTSKAIIQKLGGRTDGLMHSYDFQRGSNGTIGFIKLISNQVMGNPAIDTSIISSALIWENHSNNRYLRQTYLGDGSGAILLKKDLGSHRILSTSLTSMSEYNKVSGFKYGGTLHDITREVAQEQKLAFDILDDRHLQGIVDSIISASLTTTFRALSKADITLDEINYIGISGFQKEVNHSICQELYKPGMNVIDSLETKGYLGSVGVIEVLDKFLNDSSIKSGSTMLVVAIGVDINIESMIIRK